MSCTQGYYIACYTTSEDWETGESNRLFKVEKKELLDQKNDDATTTNTTHGGQGHNDNEHKGSDCIHRHEGTKERLMIANAILYGFS